MSPSALDHLLMLQLLVAYAGEGGEEPRLGWWRSDFVSEFGGEDLFRRLLPGTAAWAPLEAARAAARRVDTAARRRTADPDTVISLFHLGFELDERLEERLSERKRLGGDPFALVPLLGAHRPWNASAFAERVALAKHAHTVSPIGRRLSGEPPLNDPKALGEALLGALHPLPATYPLPHYVRKLA